MAKQMRVGLALLWLMLLCVSGWWVAQRIDPSGDLRKFMPTAESSAQKLLIDELGEGPGSRLLLIGLSNASPSTLAAQSKMLAHALSADKQFSFVANGNDFDMAAIPPHLRPYRYVLSPTLDTQAFNTAYLQAALEARVQDLGSPTAALIEPLLPSDPTLETLAIAEYWQPTDAPQRSHGVWFDRAGKMALLAVQTHAAGFDPSGQQSAIDAIRNAFTTIRADTDTAMLLTGPGAFSVEIGGRTQREAGWIGMVDTIGLVALLWFAYRSWRAPLLGVLPLASAGLAGLCAVALLFDGVHGITVAFGFTLIGVVQDYPIHLLSHQRAGISAWTNARKLWPTLATGVTATCIAYATFFFSGVEGLKQLAAFTIAGLGVAALSTRVLLPALMDPAPMDTAESLRLARLWAAIARMPRPRRALAVVALIGVAIIAFAPGPFWQNDLSKLTPVPAQDLARDAMLRNELGAPDVRYVLAVTATNTEQALERSERLSPLLDRLISEQALRGYDYAARYVPSAATQRERRSTLPKPEILRKALQTAIAATPFQTNAFAAFLADVETARRAPALTVANLRGTPLAMTVSGLLLENSSGTTALIALRGLSNPDRLAQMARAEGADLLDLKTASEDLVVAYRERVLAALAVAALLLSGAVWLALREPRRVLRVLMPMALTTLIVLAALRACDVELTLFHLVALILAAGLGLDYALFFEHAGDRYADQLRTLHALIVCSAMTLLVFSLLALSSIPVLRAIGSTVALGVVCNFVLALLVSRAPITIEGQKRVGA